MFIFFVRHTGTQGLRKFQILNELHFLVKITDLYTNRWGGEVEESLIVSESALLYMIFGNYIPIHVYYYVQL